MSSLLVSRKSLFELSIGKYFLIFTSVGLFAGGLTILTIGSSVIFVPQDLTYMEISVENLNNINTNLIPLIAHDRAGFGGAITTMGILIFFIVLKSNMTKSLWQALLLSGITGFGAAIGVHFVIGYTDFVHLLPAYIGAISFLFGMVLTSKNIQREL